MTDSPTPDAAPSASMWSLDRPNTRRSLTLCGLGAIVGLAIAGFGLFTAQGTRTSVVPPEDAAIVNNVPVLMVDLVTQLRALYDVSLAQATPEQRRKVLDDMIREELYVQRGIEIGLPNDDIDVRSALVSATEAQVTADAMTALPAEAELRAWYAAHPDKYAAEGTMELAEYIVPPASAAGTVARLRAGTPAAALGLRSSGRVDDGEEFYFAAEIHLGKPLFAVAKALPSGAVSDPVVQPDGAHILVMKRNAKPVPTPFEEARDQVTADFLRDKANRLQSGNERFLRKRADVKIADALQ